ncbi:MAG: acyltransferase domain-containing protein, partial [Chloroflexaceae bacterium]
MGLHLACQSLRSKECSMALAGGVNTLISPRVTIAFSKAMAMSPDGHCKTFDSRANGFVRSEGCGVVVLKRLSDALAHGDPIHALIRGTAVNQDGRTTGLTAPNGRSQQVVLRRALSQSGIKPADISYIETHGTGTALGDPIEVEALAEVYGQSRAPGQPCVLGSVKTNIGHLEAAAGMAGLIKTIMAFKHETIPPHLHFQELNPNILLHNTPFVIPTEARTWPSGNTPRYAALSSFGAGGTNAHLVLEEPPQPARPSTPDELTAQDRSVVLTLSAHNAHALRSLAQRYTGFLSEQVDGTDVTLADVCYTASLRRTHHPERLALVGATATELATHLDAFAQDLPCPGLSLGNADDSNRPRVAFICSGQGAQWSGMARLLLQREPLFRQTIEQCDEAMRPFVSWSLLELLENDANNSWMEQDTMQPALFAMTVALGTLWKSWGVTPDAVIGHSLGEVAAAYLAGILSLEDAARVICRRSQLMHRAGGQGAVAMAELTVAEAQAVLVGYENELAIAGINGPNSVLLAGDPSALECVLELLQERNVFCRKVKMNVASHTFQMEPLVGELTAALAEVRPQPGTVPFYSTVQAEVIAGQHCTASYWARNVREPVRFGPTVQQLLTDGYTTFIEVSAHPVLLASVEQVMQHAGMSGTLLPSMRRGEDGRRVLCEGLGRLWTEGYPVDWAASLPAGRCVQLPTYAWQRERFWIEADTHGSGSARRPGAAGHPLLGMHLQAATQPITHLWEAELRSTSLPYLRDHRVQGSVVVPAAAYLEIALAAANAAYGSGAHAVGQMEFSQMLLLDEQTTQIVQVALTEDADGMASVQIAARPSTAAATQPWTIHATGTIYRGPERIMSTTACPELALIQSRCTEAVRHTDLYAALRERGFTFGPTFQGISELWHGPDAALARLQPAESVVTAAAAYHLHPALLDSCFQVAGALVTGAAPTSRNQGMWLPVQVERLRLFQSPANACWSYAHRSRAATANGDRFIGDIWLLTEDGQVVLEVEGLHLKRLEQRTTPADDLRMNDWFYEVQWQPVEHPDPPPARKPGRWLLFADGQGVGSALTTQLQIQGAQIVTVTPGTKFQRHSADHFSLDAADPAAFHRLLNEAFSADQEPCRGIIHLWSLDAPPLAQLNRTTPTAAIRWGSSSVLHLMQALAQAGWREAPRLWLVSSGVHAVSPDDQAEGVSQASIWGLGRVITNEYPNMRCTRIDLGSPSDMVTRAALFAEIWADSPEDEVALRSAARYVARLVPATLDRADATIPAVAGQDAFRLEIATADRPDGVQLRATTPPEPGPGEVAIAVHAVGVTARDLGYRPEQSATGLGLECAGVITALGTGVTGLSVGDAVVALAPGCCGSFVTTAAHLVAPKPAHLSFAEAASIPATFLTAYYALHHLVSLRPGKRVLIHAATGGVGLAALQMAWHTGAEIFVTVDAPEQQTFFQTNGRLPVFDLRSPGLVRDIMSFTNGRGVDLVLHTRPGISFGQSLACLAPGGQLVQLAQPARPGHLDLRQFKPNQSLVLVDLEAQIRENPV